MESEIRNQENLIALGQYLLKIKETYPESEKVDKMLGCLAEIAVYCTEIELKNFELLHGNSLEKYRNSRTLMQKLERWIGRN